MHFLICIKNKMSRKSSQTILYFIFATIGALIFIYYLLSEKHSMKLNTGGKLIPSETLIPSATSAVTQTVEKILSEVNFDQLTNVVTDTKFSNIVIT